MLIYVGYSLIKPVFKPCGRRLLGIRSRLVNRFPTFHQAESIPDFVGKISALLAIRNVEHEVVTRRRGEKHANTYTVGAVLFHQFDGVWRIAERFGHLTPQFVANDPCEIYISEGRFLRIIMSHNNHTGHPEEQNFRRCYQVVGRVIIIELRIIRMTDTIEYGHWP